MKFKVGDKVKFIDEMGGGVVTKLIDTKLVKIKTDDGFEMPVMTTNLMPDYRSIQEESPSPYMSPPVSTPVVEDEPEFVSEINPWGKIKEENGVYIAFEPHEQQWILTGDMDVILLNNTPYELLYNLFLQRDGKMEGIDFNSVPANSKIVIETISREEIDLWTSGYLQLLFHSDTPDNIYLPVHSVIDIKTSRFFKEGSYRPNTMLNSKAIIINVIAQNTMTIVSNNEAVRKSDPIIEQNKTQVVKKKQLIDEYKKAQGEAEIDLHIAEIVDNILGMSSLDMLKLQIDTFKKVLDSAITNDYHKVTFIHGVGNGVLKNAIIKEIEDYEGIENRMASISKFGVGAIDVIIKIKD
jgi:hypothetical protein